MHRLTAHLRPAHPRTAHRLIALPLIALLFLVACGDQATVAGNDDAADNESQTSVSLAGTWELVEVIVDDQSLALPPTSLTITIADGTIQGDAGCNSFSGTIDRGDDGSLAFRDLAQTEMACDQLAFEIEYTRALVSADRWEASPDGIAFVADNARLTYQAVSDEPAIAAPLFETVWVLGSIFGPGEGPARAVSSVNADSARIEALIDSETITIQSARCTDVVFNLAVTEGNGGGSFEVTGQDDGYECEGSETANANLDTAIAGLNDATGYLLDGSRLILLGNEGELLGFVAVS